jgi:hypothetical protein
MKILVLVLSFHDNGLYSHLYRTQKETWDSIEHKDVDTFYYFGDSEKKFIKDKDIYVTAKEEHPFGLGEKFLQALDLVKDYKFDYIFKTNSSSYIDKALLIDFIKDKPINNLYCGFMSNAENIPFISGTGTYLSKDLVNYILENKSKWKHNLNEDVATGDLLSKINVKLSPGKRFDLTEASYNLSQEIDPNHYHYRCKMQYSRELDILNMHKIFNIKLNRNLLIQ